MAESFASPWSFAYHVGKDLRVNFVEIYHEIDDAITKYDSGNWEKFGEDIGMAMAKVYEGVGTYPEEVILQWNQLAELDVYILWTAQELWILSDNLVQLLFLTINPTFLTISNAYSIQFC